MPSRRERKRLQERRNAKEAAARHDVQQKPNLDGMIGAALVQEPAERCGRGASALALVGMPSPCLEALRHDEKETIYMSDGGETVCDIDSFTTPDDSGNEIPTDANEEVLCLYCFEPIGSHRPAADTVAWDRQAHENASPQCGFFTQSCADCLEDFINRHEQEPEKLGSYPCPLCRFALREPTMENVARCACAKSLRASEQFHGECQALLDSLNDAHALPGRLIARGKRDELGMRDKARKTALEEVPDMFKSETWCQQAHANYSRDSSLYRKARRSYRMLWPGQPAAVGTWEAYDPAMWEAADNAETGW